MPERDEEIASKVQRGDTESFGILVERYEPKLMRYARKFLSDTEDMKDVLQNVFLKVYSNIQSFDTKRKFSPWIYRIAHNEFVNTLKKRKNERLRIFDLDTFLPYQTSSETADGEANGKDLKSTLNDCLDQIDTKYREPLVLYYFEEMNYKEIAEVLHIPVSTVGVRMMRGKKILKEVYRKKYE